MVKLAKKLMRVYEIKLIRPFGLLKRDKLSENGEPLPGPSLGVVIALFLLYVLLFNFRSDVQFQIRVLPCRYENRRCG